MGARLKGETTIRGHNYLEIKGLELNGVADWQKAEQEFRQIKPKIEKLEKELSNYNSIAQKYDKVVQEFPTDIRDALIAIKWFIEKKGETQILDLM